MQHPTSNQQQEHNLTKHDRLVQALEQIEERSPFTVVGRIARAALDAHRQAQPGPANIAGEGEIP